MAFEERVEMGQWWLISFGGRTTVCKYAELGSTKWNTAHTYLNGESIRLRKTLPWFRLVSWYWHYNIKRADMPVKNIEKVDTYMYRVMRACGMKSREAFYIAIGVDPNDA